MDQGDAFVVRATESGISELFVHWTLAARRGDRTVFAFVATFKFRFAILACTAALALVPPQVSQAGAIYTTRATYEAAVAGLALSWIEDFEGFALGATPVPTIIGGGSAEITLSGSASIIDAGFSLPPGGSKEWLNDRATVGETIQGLLGASLGVNAIGFDYYSAAGGSYNFHHSGGADSDASRPAVTPLFVGWVGSAGEVLDFVDYTPGTSAHVLDDIVAYVVPEPTTASLLALGLVGIAAGRRHRVTR